MVLRGCNKGNSWVSEVSYRVYGVLQGLIDKGLMRALALLYEVFSFQLDSDSRNKQGFQFCVYNLGFWAVLGLGGLGLRI